MSTVVILGGGVAGLSAAHELVERGFTVHVYEKKPTYLGGKARSVDVPDSAENNRGPLPGEHGFRFFPGFYRHITDTMKRIPFTDANGRKNPNGVYDNLVEVERVSIMRDGQPPIIVGVNFPKSWADVKGALAGLRTLRGNLKPGEGRVFAGKIAQLMTSCRRRREIDYERIGWWEYTEADRHSEAYSHLLVDGLTRTLVAANAKYASTKTGGNIFLQLIFNMLDPLVHTDRVLNGPTNAVWLKPWESYLERKGVRFFRGALVEGIEINERGNVSAVQIQDWQKSQRSGNRVAYNPPAVGDFYVLAIPVEVAATVLPDSLKQQSGNLCYIDRLADDVAWMNGIQFYRKESIDQHIVKSHHIHVDSEWALTSISQLPFWPGYDVNGRGNGQVKAILSVDISDWDDASPTQPGLPSRPAKDCPTYDQIADRVWAQLKGSLRDPAGNPVLRDEMRVLDYPTGNLLHKGYYLDRSINLESAPADVTNSGATSGQTTPAARDPAASDVGKSKQEDALKLVNHEPLLVNTINSWALRPDAQVPELKNLFLASDYVRTNTDLATMEGANEAARRAVNAILDVTGSPAPRCRVWQLGEPAILTPFKWYDDWRYRSGAAYRRPPTWFISVLIPWMLLCGIGFLALVGYFLLKTTLQGNTRPAEPMPNRPNRPTPAEPPASRQPVS